MFPKISQYFRQFLFIRFFASFFGLGPLRTHVVCVLRMSWVSKGWSEIWNFSTWGEMLEIWNYSKRGDILDSSTIVMHGKLKFLHVSIFSPLIWLVKLVTIIRFTICTAMSRIPSGMRIWKCHPQNLRYLDMKRTQISGEICLDKCELAVSGWVLSDSDMWTSHTVVSVFPSHLTT